MPNKSRAALLATGARMNNPLPESVQVDSGTMPTNARAPLTYKKSAPPLC